MSLARVTLNLGTSAALVAAQLAPLPLVGPVGGFMGVAPALAQQRTQIQCYSVQGQQNSCSLPPGARDITYMGPDRSGRCREGSTWRQRGNTLWVTGGCGGVFEMSYSGSGGGWGGSGGSGGGWGGSGGSGGGWGGSGGSGGFAGEVTCRSQNYEPQTCRVNTGGRVTVVQQLSREPCIEGQNFRFDNRSITVRNGCQARFGYGYGNNNGGGWGGGGGNWGGGNGGFQAELRCSSNRNAYQRCPADTQNRVVLVRQVSDAECRQGSSWGYDNGGIWVNRGCQGYFAYGYGNYQPSYGGGSGNGGSGGGGGGSGVAAGFLGAGLAAGLIALLNSKGAKADTSNPNARVTANYGLFPGAAQAEAKACMEESARQLGQSGATAITLNSVVSAQPSGNGWRTVADITGTWPRETNRLEIDCSASGSKVTAFDVKAR
jgi:hypothetical protein